MTSLLMLWALPIGLIAVAIGLFALRRRWLNELQPDLNRPPSAWAGTTIGVLNGRVRRHQDRRQGVADRRSTTRRVASTS